MLLSESFDNMTTCILWRCQWRSLIEVPLPGEDATVDRVASAAFEVFAEYGIRRATIDDVARRAGVSKMTVFRRFQSKQGLVGVVIAREIRRGMAELDRVWEREQTLEQRVVLGFSFAVNFVRGHALVRPASAHRA